MYAMIKTYDDDSKTVNIFDSQEKAIQELIKATVEGCRIEQESGQNSNIFDEIETYLNNKISLQHMGFNKTFNDEYSDKHSKYNIGFYLQYGTKVERATLKVSHTDNDTDNILECATYDIVIVDNA